MIIYTNNIIKAISSKQHLIPNIRELETSILCAIKLQYTRLEKI
jgi:hypothetical protein